MALRSTERLACCRVVTPSVAYAFAIGEKSSKSVPMSSSCPPEASVTSTERPASWLSA